ncbi:MAG: von Willebrand factor type A domain-containing protein [Deltaproteobacteria bacterium]|nr:von Willebrand factor type A domain-containing protein [Deltaproteobacteria bacterium]
MSLERQPSEQEIALTAFALGELEGEARARVAEAIARDPALLAEVEAIRRVAGELEKELGRGPELTLRAEQRSELEAALRGTPVNTDGPSLHRDRAPRPARRARRGLKGALIVGASAAVALLALASASLRPEIQRVGPPSGPGTTVVANGATLDPSTPVGEDHARSLRPAEPTPTVPRMYAARPAPTRSIRENASTGAETKGWFYTQESPHVGASLGAAPQEVTALLGSAPPPAALEPAHGEGYASTPENPFRMVDEAPLSTFSIDVDTASYANIRRFLDQGQWPPVSAVRIEEMLNYFPYRLPPPSNGQPFSLYVDVTDAPWNSKHLLARVALKAKEIARTARPRANLVFLVDVSGSMNVPNRLPLVKQSLSLLLEELGADDTVALVVYAGASGLVLPPTRIAERGAIQSAIDRLEAGGSTNGGSGIQLAYSVAQLRRQLEGTNRVILATDGDFNVGVTDRGELERLITAQAKSGVFLSVLGFGMGNYQDANLELLADKGNGNYAYIDRLDEARKVLVEELAGTIHTVAKDVKVQLELNPARIGAYRLIGYENRALAAKDFADDKKDAGEVGAGHAVTALYELIPAGSPELQAPEGNLRYRDPRPLSPAATSGELFTVKLRYKEPTGDTSQLIEKPVHEVRDLFREGSDDLRFAAAVAAFGMILRDSPHKGDATLEQVHGWAKSSVAGDPGGYRRELVKLVERASTLRRQQETSAGLCERDMQKWLRQLREQGVIDGSTHSMLVLKLAEGAPYSCDQLRRALSGRASGRAPMAQPPVQPPVLRPVQPSVQPPVLRPVQPSVQRPVPLGDDDVLRVLRQHEAEIADCRARQVRADPAVAGVMEVAFVVMPSGQPAQITVASEKFQGTTIAKCVIQAMSAWRLPAFSGAPIPMRIPIGLEPQR